MEQYCYIVETYHPFTCPLIALLAVHMFQSSSLDMWQFEAGSHAKASGCWHGGGFQAVCFGSHHFHILLIYLAVDIFWLSLERMPLSNKLKHCPSQDICMSFNVTSSPKTTGNWRICDWNFRWIQMIGQQPPSPRPHIARRGHKIINWIDPTDKVVFWAPKNPELETNALARLKKSADARLHEQSSSLGNRCQVRDFKYLVEGGR